MPSPMRDLPSGTVTFLFTDVEGSTQLLHELGAERYAQALAEHRRVIREACAAQGGVEVDTQGDAFFFAFPRAEEALAAAAEFTETLAAGPVQVRAGLHTGMPLLTDEGYVGQDVHFAARVAAAAHGGQVVVSSATAAIVGGSLVDLGEHRLKDVEGAVAIFQLGDGAFPPLKTISNTNLPRPASSFVGRDRELAEVLGRIERGARLVTLTGPGGSGKTRLAIEAAATLVPEYKAGVFWVGLAALRDPALVTETIAQTLGAKDGLAEHVGERELLLLLDNLEQVIESAPELSTLLQQCPNLTLLVTSRELLRVHGEVEYAVPPLAEPEAVALFCERAQLEPSEEIAELCARVDNLPLAVELAAARTKALTPAQILERLSSRLDLLKGGRDADPRQQTLRATIEWSYDLLSADEQQLFARLSVFAGGCTLEAAAEVAGADLDTLQSLVEKSLLRFTDERFWMLETIREFACERMNEATHLRGVAQRHAEYFARAAYAASDQAQDRPHSARLEEITREEDNFRGALAWAVEHDEGTVALRISGALWHFWAVRGHVREGREWLERALATATSAPAAEVARALDGLAYLMAITGDATAAVAVSDRSLGLWREVGDRVGLARSLLRRQIVVGALDDDEAYRATCEETIGLAREIGASDVLATSLNNLADDFLVAGDYERAANLCAESIAIHRRHGDAYDIVAALIGAGHAALAQHRLREAGAHYDEALAVLAETDAPDVLAQCIGSVAALAEAHGDPVGAARLLGASESLLGRAEAARTWPYEERQRGETLARLRATLEEHELEALFERGAEISEEQATAEAIAAARIGSAPPP
jgi:predicted ATPase/class 3 adenylate cyclase